MTKTFTQNDVIRFVYEELTSPEREEIQNAIIINNELLEYYKEVDEIINDLHALRLKPSDRVTENILSYSRSLSLHSA